MTTPLLLARLTMPVMLKSIDYHLDIHKVFIDAIEQAERIVGKTQRERIKGEKKREHI
jgi:hypothetical protein